MSDDDPEVRQAYLALMNQMVLLEHDPEWLAEITQRGEEVAKQMGLATTPPAAEAAADAAAYARSELRRLGQLP